MPIYRYSATGLEQLAKTSLTAERIRERQDLQRMLLQQIDVLGADLLAIAEEYSLFQDSRRRIDILALDKAGTLVVIELKRTEDGGHMELQAVRYAAMVSTMTLDHLVEAFAAAKGLAVSEARQTILDWVDEPLDELPNHVRIMLVSADFSTEITSTVLWLNENYGMDVSCFRITAHRLQEEVLLDLQQIIPLPEAKDFQIQQRQKGSVAAADRAMGRDFTRYNVMIGTEKLHDLSKQSAVKIAIQLAYQAGVPVPLIKRATQEGRWMPVHPLPGETVEDAFRREYPTTSSSHRWFDLGVVEDDVSWVIPRFGGPSTEAMLDSLAAAARPILSLTWSRSAEDPATRADPRSQESRTFGSQWRRTITE